MPLEHAHGRFFNPQYTLLEAAGIATSATANKMATRCSIAGRQVRDFRFTIHSPGATGGPVMR